MLHMKGRCPILMHPRLRNNCRAIDKRSFADALLAAGFMRLVIQKGDGQFRPCNILPHAHIWNVLDNGLYVECFNFRPSLEKELATASLVISHAGARKCVGMLPLPVFAADMQPQPR